MIIESIENQTYKDLAYKLEEYFDFKKGLLEDWKNEIKLKNKLINFCHHLVTITQRIKRKIKNLI
jgi:hypothetical protein